MLDRNNSFLCAKAEEEAMKLNTTLGLDRNGSGEHAKTHIGRRRSIKTSRGKGLNKSEMLMHLADGSNGCVFCMPFFEMLLQSKRERVYRM